jgi:glycosyltransferase involved in cell wall biosynthesis
MAPLVLCTLATYNHLHLVLAQLRSVARHWPAPPEARVLLVDGHALPRPGFEALPWVRFLTPEQVGAENLAWLAAKLNATDLCCALKPYLLRHLLAAGAECLLYADADQLFFADPAPLLDCAPRAPLVVTPHVLTPLPAARPFERPSLGDLAGAGMMNAGICLLRNGPAVRGFVEQWAGLVSGPGAFLGDLGLQHEQNAFNWSLAFLDQVAVCRDPRVNIAYWNLHERPLRWAQLDDGPADLWLLDGRPPVTVHFSGFDWQNGRFSHYDQRHAPGLNINLKALGDYYAGELAAAGQAHYGPQPYYYALCGELQLLAETRLALRRAERFGTPWWPAWPSRAAELVAPLLGAPGERIALPEFLARIYDQRPDLQALNGNDVLFPRQFLAWCEGYLVHEYPAQGGALLAADCWMAERRGQRRLLGCGAAVSLRRLFAEDAGLAERFPRPLDGDRAAFQAGGAAALLERWEVPAAVRAFAAGYDPAASLGRVCAYLRQVPELLAALRAEGFGRRFLMSLLPHLRERRAFTLDDVVLLDWWLEQRALQPGPARQRRFGQRLYALAQRRPALQRHAHRLRHQLASRRRLAPLAGMIATAQAAARDARDHGLDALLLPFLADLERPVARQGYLAWWSQRRGLPPGSVATAEAVLAGAPAPAGLPGLSPAPGSVNLFGHFKSPIGLANVALGLDAGLARAGYAVTRQVLTNQAMAGDLRVEDLYPDFDFGAPRNIAVAYPHRQYDLDQLFPSAFFKGRETIGYLAWEQRDLHPDWARRLAKYDRLWGLSRFTAESVAKATGRHCAPVACVVEVDEARARAFGRRHFGLPEERFLVGFVFDAGSGVERKNPMAAARAIARAYAGRRDVAAVVKMTGGDRPQHAALLRALRALMQDAGLELHLVTAVLPRAEVEGLMACLDLYVSLHRAEGFGYTMAEAMLLGVPVVATGYSGNLDFMRPENSCLVRWRETLVREADGPFQPGTVWAEPDVEHAAELCAWLSRDRAARERLAVIAAADARRLLSVEALAARLPALLA